MAATIVMMVSAVVVVRAVNRHEYRVRREIANAARIDVVPLQRTELCIAAIRELHPAIVDLWCSRVGIERIAPIVITGLHVGVAARRCDHLHFGCIARRERRSVE